MEARARVFQKLTTAVLYAGTFAGAVFGSMDGYRLSGWNGVPVGLIVMGLVGGIAAFPVAGLVYGLGILICQFGSARSGPKSRCDATDQPPPLEGGRKRSRRARPLRP